MMAIFYLVRHGRTDFINKKLCGNLPGIHLNTEGKVQAQKVADYLGTFPIKALHSSPLERARETIAPLSNWLGMMVNVEDFLREINFGDLQGKGKELFEYPIWQLYNTHPAEVQFPNGESVLEAQERVVAGLDELSKRYSVEDQVVCVAHCDVLRLAVAHVINLPVDNFHNLTIDPASITKVEWTSERKKLHALNYIPA